MAKYYGKIGYFTTVETTPGVWTEIITDKYYKGDIIRNTRRLTNDATVNNNITINNQISIVADPYAINNFHSMVYAEFMGVLWKITSVEVQYPRLILDLGGEYNGEQA